MVTSDDGNDGNDRGGEGGGMVVFSGIFLSLSLPISMNNDQSGNEPLSYC